MNIYICKHCGNIILKLKDSKVNISCCNENMELLIPNTVDAAVEKHIPIVEINENEVVVTIGSVIHPMDENHYIEWIVLETNDGYQIKYLKPLSEPKVIFNTNNEVINVYAYCNLHGLWKNS